jgi:hypothetical protein
MKNPSSGQFIIRQHFNYAAITVDSALTLASFNYKIAAWRGGRIVREPPPPTAIFPCDNGRADPRYSHQLPEQTAECGRE